MPASASSKNSAETETEVAILKVEVSHLREDVGEIKDSINSLHDAIDANSKETVTTLKKIQESSDTAHKELSKKIATLEKWRWTMIGAGIVLAGIGWETVAKLLK